MAHQHISVLISALRCCER